MRFDYLRLIVNDLLRRKFSSFLTLFAISLGILAIFVIFLLSQGFENSIQEQFDKLGSNRLYITSSSTSLASTTFTKGLSDIELKLIENKPFVDKVYPYVSRNVQIKYGKEFKNNLIMGGHFTKKYFDDLGLTIDKGRIPKLSEKYPVMVGPLVVKDKFNKKIVIGSNIYVKDTKFKVVGILKSVGNPQDDSNIYFSLDTIRDLYSDGNKIGFMDVVIVEGYDVALAKTNLKIVLENKLGKDSINIIVPTELLEQMSGILDIVKLTLGGIGFVALIVGALGIINTMYVVVTEKTREIGIMKSIGAKNSDILFMYIFQAGLFGFLGAILGVFFGSFTALGFEVIAKSAGYTFLKIVILPEYIISLLFFGIIIGIIAGYLPARKASKINIIEAIRK